MFPGASLNTNHKRPTKMAFLITEIAHRPMTKQLKKCHGCLTWQSLVFRMTGVFGVFISSVFCIVVSKFVCHGGLGHRFVTPAHRSPRVAKVGYATKSTSGDFL